MAVKKKSAVKKKQRGPATVVSKTENIVGPVIEYTGRRPGTIEIPRIRVLALVYNMMDDEADKSAGPEMLAECMETLTQDDVDNFVLRELPKLPGYNVRDALKILDCLTRFRQRYFA